MSDKKINPLFEEGEKEVKAPAKEQEKPKVEAKVEAKVEPAAEKMPKEKLKQEAIAKFPKDIVAQTKYILDNSEHINFIVPLQPGETDFETVQINGYKLTIKKNVMVNIPKQVAEILAEKYRIAMTAGQDKRIDRSSDISEALR
jgi:hypothetical protein